MTNPETQWREAYEAWFHSVFHRTPVYPSLEAKMFKLGYLAGYLAASPKRPEVEEVARGLWLFDQAATINTGPERYEALSDISHALYVGRAKTAIALIFGEPKTEEGTDAKP